MTKILSVSIAAYNVSKTIEQCLDSFINSQYVKDFEVIVVNDGSKDETVDIVSTYVKDYPDTIRLIDKENGGHGSTINAALRVAQGKYFKVVDGDDWVDTKEFDKLIEFLKKTNVDLVLNDYMEVYPEHSQKVDVLRKYQLNQEYTFKDMDPNYYIPMHATTIKLTRYKEVEESISEHRFYVDTEFVAFLAMAADSIAFHDACVYQYRLGSEGQSVSDEGKYKHIEDLIFVVERLIKFYHDKVISLSDEVKKNYIFHIIESRYLMVFYWFVRFSKSDKDYMLKEFDCNMRSNYPEIVNQMHLGKHKIYRINYGTLLKIARVIKAF